MKLYICKEMFNGVERLYNQLIITVMRQLFGQVLMAVKLFQHMILKK